MIPIIAAFLQRNVTFFYEKKLLKLLFIIIISFITVKYGYRNIVEKRFNDFQWTDMSLHVQGDKINENLSGLKWVTPKYWGLSPKVKNEVEIIKKISKILTEDKRNKVLMTNYQLFLVTSKSHIYYTQPTFFLNSTQPDINNKYYKYYTEYYNDYIKKNNIEVFYFLDVDYKFYKNFINNICKIENIKIYKYDLYYFDIGDCK